MSNSNRFCFARLDERRQAKDLTWRRLARLCQAFGWPSCSERGLMRYVKGIQPVPEHVATLADALGCKVMDLCEPTRCDAPPETISESASRKPGNMRDRIPLRRRSQ